MATKLSAKQVLKRRAADIEAVRAEYFRNAGGDATPRDVEKARDKLYRLAAELLKEIADLQRYAPGTFAALDIEVPINGVTERVLTRLVGPLRAAKMTLSIETVLSITRSTGRAVVGGAEIADALRRDHRGRPPAGAKEKAVADLAAIWESATGEPVGSLSSATRFGQFMSSAGEGIFSLTFARNALKNSR